MRCAKLCSYPRLVTLCLPTPLVTHSLRASFATTPPSALACLGAIKRLQEDVDIEIDRIIPEGVGEADRDLLEAEQDERRDELDKELPN